MSRVSQVALGVALLFPFVVVGVLSSEAISTWLSNGFCPGGAMDQAAAPCGFFPFFAQVFLGGWAMFVVVPVYAVWWLLCFWIWRIAKRRAPALPGYSS